MISRLINSSLFRSAGIYVLTSGINSAIPFLLLPVLTRYMSPEDYGIVAMFGVLVSFIVPFTGLSIHGAIARMYYEKESIDIKVYVTNCLLILIYSTVVVSLIFYILAEPISKLSLFPLQLLWIVIAVSFGQYLTRVVLTLWQVQVKPVQYGVYQISQTLLNAGLSILLVVSLGMTWRGRIEAQLITLIVFSIIGIVTIWRNNWLKFELNLSYIKHAISFGVPLIPHALGGVIITMTDRVFITNMVGLEATGIYSVGYQVGMIIGLLATSFNQAYVPWLYQQLSLNDFTKKLTIVKLTYGYNLAIFILAVSLALIAPWFLVFFVGKEFAGSGVFVVWIAIGQAFQGMYYMVGSYIFYAQKTAILAWITFASALINIVLNYILISKFGAIGAAQATTLTNLIVFVATWVLSMKVYQMPWLLNYRR